MEGAAVTGGHRIDIVSGGVKISMDGSAENARTIYFDGGMHAHRICVYDEEDDRYYIERTQEATNNRIEYAALLRALDVAGRYKGMVVVAGDSRMVIEQVSGASPAPTDDLARLLRKTRDRLHTMRADVRILWVPREENKAGIRLEELKTMDKKMPQACPCCGGALRSGKWSRRSWCNDCGWDSDG